MPRAGLTPQVVTEHALAVIDEGGLDALTLAAVAARAGVAVPSLYKHVESLPALRRAVSLVCVRELTVAMTDAGSGVTGREAVVRLAHAVRAFGLAHPGRYAASQVAGDSSDPRDAELSDAGWEAVSVLARAFATLGLEASAVVDAVRLMRSAVHGFIVLERDGGFGLPDDLDASFAVLVDAVADAVEKLATRQGNAQVTLLG